MVGAKMTATELADLIGMCGDGGYNQDAATMLRSQEKYINRLHRLCNANGLGAGKDLLTGEIIPFEVNE